jgi:hypothetical protein
VGNAWRYGPIFNTPRVGSSAAGTISPKGYVAGGRDSSGANLTGMESTAYVVCATPTPTPTDTPTPTATSLPTATPTATATKLPAGVDVSTVNAAPGGAGLSWVAGAIGLALGLVLLLARVRGRARS